LQMPAAGQTAYSPRDHQTRHFEGRSAAWLAEATFRRPEPEEAPWPTTPES